MFQYQSLTCWMDGSAFCDRNIQISSLHCSFAVFYSFLGQLITSLLTNKKHMFFCVKLDKLCALQCHWLVTSTSVNILWLTVRKGQFPTHSLTCPPSFTSWTAYCQFLGYLDENLKLICQQDKVWSEGWPELLVVKDILFLVLPR